MKLKVITEAIGNTPLIELSLGSNLKKIRVFAKLEGVNPGGSVKDRVADYMIKRAEAEWRLKKGSTIIEATSGNTGIGLAMISALKGYKFLAVMAENVSEERKTLLKSMGATLIFSPAIKGTNGAIEKTEEITREDKSLVWLNQFEDYSNVLAHYSGTGEEIRRDLNKVDYFVVGLGTGGTIMGAGKRLKENNPQIKIIGIQPAAGEQIAGLRRMEGYIPGIFKAASVDMILEISNSKAVYWMREIMKKEGLSVGPSSGAAYWGVLQISKQFDKGNIVTIFPDRADRYLSTEALRVLE